MLLHTLRAGVAQLLPGERLATTRQLVERHRVSPVTVSRTLAILAAEGLVETRPGSGTYVAERQPPATGGDVSWQALALGDRPVSSEALTPLLDPPREEGVISLATGYPHPSLMPTRLLATA